MLYISKNDNIEYEYRIDEFGFHLMTVVYNRFRAN